MDVTNLNRARWKKKTPHRSPLLSISLLALLFFLFFFLAYKNIPKSLHPISSTTLTVRFPQCGIRALGERFLWYAPHSGFSNQVSVFKNAVLMAGILNRTLIVPPILDHHAVALGSCPKFRVLGPNEIRVSVWDHAIDLIRSRRSLLSGLDGDIKKCLYALQEDCRTTVWTYQQNNEDGVLDSFQPDEQLQKKKKISYVRRRRDVYKTLGRGSEAELATVLAFGSLFTAPYKGSELYIDINEAPRDKRVQSLIEKIEYLPFVPEIMSAGKDYAFEIIKGPFLCVQLRLLDGQFKNHWKATFLELKQKVEFLRKKGLLPIHMFVMTDLLRGNWTGSYLGDLARDFNSFKLFVLREEDELVTQTAKKLMAAGHSMKFGSFPKSLDRVSKMENHCSSQMLADILLYLEETVCSCASLGFVGTAGSTIAESIELMRKFGICSSQSQTAS